MAERTRRRRARAAALKQQIPFLLALVLLWVFLWGDEFSWANLAMGVLVAVAIPVIYYLPPIELTGRANPVWIVWFVARLLFDVTRSSVIVAAQAFGLGYSPHEAIIEVKMRTRSDLVLTATAEASTLVPGTLVLDVDREKHALFVHVFSVRSQADIDKARKHTLDTEARIIRAIGSPDEYRKLKKEQARQKGGAT